MARVAMVILGLIALVGWSVARASIRAGVKLMGERDEARAALDRFRDLPDDDSTFVRVNAETLRSIVDFAEAMNNNGGSRLSEFDAELRYMRERLRTVTR